FVYHDRIQPFTVDSSNNIVLKNLTVDWDIPLTAQAVVLEATDSYVDVQINAYESPYLIENGRLVFVGEGWKSAWKGTMEFDRDRRNVVPRTGDPGCMTADGDFRAEELSKGKVRIHAAYRRTPAVGNLLVLRHSERDHAGIFIVDSRNVSVENVDVHHCAGLGILAQYSENLSFTNVNNIPNEAKGRILAGHDDGFQISNCRGKVTVERCTFHALMDDPINVHGTSVRIVERRDDYTLRCKFMHHQSVGMTWARTGESVGFIDNQSMQTVALGTVKAYRRESNEVFEIEFVQPVPSEVKPDYALEHLTWTCDVSVANSHFKSCRARGMLVSTPGKVTIADNVFESSGSAILIAGDANGWFESGAVRDVTIARNTFKSPCLTSMYQFCEAVISIYPIVPQRTATPFHRNIRIIDNRFELYDYPILYALSTDGVEFSNNQLVRSYDFEPFHHRKHGLTFEYCRNIVVKGNTVEGEVLGTGVKLVNTPKKEYKTDKGSCFKVVGK
ncbi:MAG: right-handed parallel beta-helix repeat-containing protein, partial [Tannerella sp.]|nr:right-handed parallel beta-helix repeat-containing protein [Tannerella sp.]